MEEISAALRALHCQYIIDIATIDRRIKALILSKLKTIIYEILHYPFLCPTCSILSISSIYRDGNKKNQRTTLFTY